VLGISRSVALYYGRPIRLARTIGFYKRILPTGGLYFDVGAHVGHRVWAARKAGARAVAIEPQPSCQPILNWMFGNDPNVVVERRPIAEAERPVSLHISPTHPTVTSINRSWVDKVGNTPGFRRVRWSDKIDVEATTLDRLIEAHGKPDFCKIDIEGGEEAALAGLSQPIDVISIERLPEALADFDGCLNALMALGDYRFNWCRGEKPEFASTRWVSANQLKQQISKESRVCDVFAALPSAAARL